MIMTKQELVDRLYEKYGEKITKRLAANIIDSVFDDIAQTIKRERRFSYPGFGTWLVRNRKARVGRNPQTGEEIKIKASKSVGFRAAKALKERV
jgi:DNA-binding protein HU-beta